MTDKQTTHIRWLTPSRIAFIEQLRAVDTSWDPWLVVALARSAADDIERLAESLMDAERVMSEMENQHG